MVPAPLERRLNRLGRDFSGRFGLYAFDLRRREEIAVRADAVFPSASTIKLFVLRELYRQAEAGVVDLAGDCVEMGERDRVIGSGVIKDLTAGLALSLRDAATLMVTVSDNTATNLLIARLGVRAINTGARRAGYSATHLHGLFFRGRGIRGSVTSPADTGRLLLSLAHGRELSRRASADMLDILRREQYANIIGRLIPYDPYAPGRQRWRLASKSGSIRGVRNDAGYVVGPGCRYVISLMSDGCSDDRFNVDNEANLFLAEVAREVHEWFGRT